jgi:peptide-methionine (S)-S-oxide reductase
MPMYSLTKYADSKIDPNDPHSLESYPAATFGAGCYWGVEQAYRDVPGVLATAVGFMGGRVKNPTYERVCRGDTGHAESVQLRYDPNQVSYGQLLTVFFEIHNPTLKNRQGNDIGTQYRSAIFFHTPEQKKEALLARAALDKSGKYRRPIETEITAAREFWLAEEYHQRYLEKNPGGYCHIQFPIPVIEEMKEESKK